MHWGKMGLVICVHMRGDGGGPVGVAIATEYRGMHVGYGGEALFVEVA